MQLTLSEAAALLGHKSRSTLYRLLKDGFLQAGGYLRGAPGRWRIETDPGDGRRPFAEWAAAVIGSQGPMRREPARQVESVAVGAVPALEPMTDDVRRLAGDLEFWAEWGQLAESGDAPLSGGEFWENVAAMLSGLMGAPYESEQVAELAHQLDSLRAAVAAGARWDGRRWVEASARSLLEDPEVMEGSCPYSRVELEALAAGGLLPADLQALAEQALAAYSAREVG